jgi:hypothetical protein
MRKLVSLMLSIALLLTMATPAMAGYTAIENLRTSGKMSDEFVSSIHVNLLSVPQGSVTAYVYEGINQTLSTSNFEVKKQERLTAKSKLHTFFFIIGEEYGPDTIMGVDGEAQDQSVIGYVYGPQKTEAINSFILGIVECLGNPQITQKPSSGGSSSSSKTIIEPVDNPDEWVTKYYPKATFTVSSTTYTVDNQTLEMDSTPYIANDRTYVPVRYLAYSLGVQEENIIWDNDARKVSITKDDTTIVLIIGSPVMFVNGQSTRMDVSPEITNDRTFLPARWVAEALGAAVEWDDTTKQAIIKMPIESED